MTLYGEGFSVVLGSRCWKVLGGVLIPRESSRLNVATTFLLWRASLF